jgi:shikimate kinase
MRVFLVGPMGAGKSTVGRRLANLLNLQFVDADAEIEARAGADIPWIFDVEGEAGFRNREQAVIADLARREQVVVATGGGAILREANRSAMAASGIVVYLHAPVEEQLRRTRKDNRRPLLNVADPGRVLADLMAVREPLYRAAADIVIAATGASPGRVADKLKPRVVEALAARQIPPEDGS